MSHRFTRPAAVLTLLGAACLAGGCGDDPTPAPANPPAAGGPGSGAGEAPADPPRANQPTLGDPALGDARLKQIHEAMSRGRAFLLGAQDGNGGWGEPAIRIPPNAGYTGMAAMALIASQPQRSVKADEALKRALTFLAGLQKESGAIFDDDNPLHTTYSTSVSVGAFALAKISAFANAQVRARNYLAASQIHEDEADPSYGGFPYKQKTTGAPADLSNAQMAAQALADAGLEKDHELWKRMQRYLQRVHNFSEVNDYVVDVPSEVEGETRTVVSGNDGGAGYQPGVSKADYIKRSDGKFEVRSYGSMSYALLKCLLFSGVPADDPRVAAVVGWISRNWTLERNPGFEAAKDPEKAGQQGYYYFLYTAARALADYERALGKPVTIRDADGRAHNWRAEMVERFLAAQGEDGAWVNPVADRWAEGSKTLCTSYALQALGFLTNRLP